MCKLIVANWKMNGSINFIEEFIHGFNKCKNSNKNLNKVIICPPFPYLLLMSKLIINHSIIKLGSQDISHFKEYGAFTGEVNGLMLKDCSVKYVIVGHSERREYFNENNLIIQNKLLNCVDNSLQSILCVGEDLLCRKNSRYKDVIFSQLQVIKDINLSEVIIAYEPIWAIGTGQNASVNQIIQIHKFIFETIKSFNLNNLISLKIIYGGSVNELNYQDILNLDYVDGILVGGASLNINHFIKFANYNNCNN